MLSTLALDRRRVWSVDELADALYGDDSRVARIKTVRNRVSELRARFGSSLVRTVGSGYQLGDDVTLDADEFVALAARPDLPSESLQTALLAWRGRAG